MGADKHFISWQPYQELKRCLQNNFFLFVMYVLRQLITLSWLLEFWFLRIFLKHLSRAKYVVLIFFFIIVGPSHKLIICFNRYVNMSLRLAWLSKLQMKWNHLRSKYNSNFGSEELGISLCIGAATIPRG